MHEIEQQGEEVAYRHHEWLVRMAGRCDPGRVRDNNEDYLDWDARRGLAVLADGVGGRNAGEVASRMAVTTLLEELEPPYTELTGEVCSDTLRRVVEHANKRIYESAQYAPFLGMSTTLAALWLCNRTALLAHVGDSRIYRLRSGQLQQITVDHSLVQEMVDNGVLSLEEAQHSANRHVITRALGLSKQVDVALLEEELCSGDRYLLCSDGVSDMLDEATLAALLLTPHASLHGTVEAVIEEANHRGGRDNIAALLVAIDSPE